MKTKIYAIFDQAAQAFTPPFFMHNDGLAIRAFSDNVNSQEENNLSKHYEQFALYQLGEFDDKSGAIDSAEPKIVISGQEVKQPTPKDNILEELAVIKDMIHRGQ